MFRAATWCSLTLAVCTLSFCGAQSKPKAGKTKPQPVVEKAPSRQTGIDWPATLNKIVSLEKGIDPMPLREAVENVQDLFHITILVDSQAFRTDLSDDDVEGKQVKLPKMNGVRLSTVLRLLTEQVNATYVLRSDYLEITPWQRVRAVERRLLPVVSAQIDQVPLLDALKELSNNSDFNIVLDSRLLERCGKIPITAVLRTVPVDTAARVVAEGAGLKVVLIDNVLFVTLPETAVELEAEKESRRGEGGGGGGMA
jgi:hypothetical protein